MAYKTLMVLLEINGDNAALLNITGDLAEQFGARVIGIAACQPIQLTLDQGFGIGEAIVRDRAEIANALTSTEAQFHSALAARAKGLQWRSKITSTPLADYVADEARAADLVIIGKDIGGDPSYRSQRVDVGDFLMQAGRPVLLVPAGVTSLSFQHVFVGWNESREARRAAANALPLLKLSKRTVVLEICSEDRKAVAQTHVNDVVSWLGEHEVVATPKIAVASGSEGSFLHAKLRDSKCDLFVAGAYGHNRLREWMFGSVTQDALLHFDFCVLTIH